jgi:hypothetical protein
MLLAMNEKATNPKRRFISFARSRNSPAKKRGINKNRFFAQSFGLNSLR